MAFISEIWSHLGKVITISKKWITSSLSETLIQNWFVGNSPWIRGCIMGTNYVSYLLINLKLSVTPNICIAMKDGESIYIPLNTFYMMRKRKATFVCQFCPKLWTLETLNTSWPLQFLWRHNPNIWWLRGERSPGTRPTSHELEWSQQLSPGRSIPRVRSSLPTQSSSSPDEVWVLGHWLWIHWEHRHKVMAHWWNKV